MFHQWVILETVKSYTMRQALDPKRFKEDNIVNLN